MKIDIKTKQKKSAVSLRLLEDCVRGPLRALLRVPQHNARLKFIMIIGLAVILCSFSGEKTLQGTWIFIGSLFNGKYDGPPKDYILQRKYTADKYDAYVLEKGAKPEKFESGKYKLLGDTCYETQTYSSQPTKLKGVTVHYQYVIRHDSLILHAKLPNGYYEDDYWKKVK